MAKREEELRGAGGAEEVREDPEALKAPINLTLVSQTSPTFETNSDYLQLPFIPEKPTLRDNLPLTSPTIPNRGNNSHSMKNR